MMEQKQFEKIMWHIIRSIEKAGYDAEEQITAYLLTGTDRYITRQGDARNWIKKLDKEQIKEFYGLL